MLVGAQVVAAGGTASALTIKGGTQLVSGTAAGTIVSGGTQRVFGLASGATLSAGIQIVEAGGTASNTIDKGGTELVSVGAVDSGAQISRGTQLVYGSAFGATVFSGIQIVEPGGTATSAALIATAVGASAGGIVALSFVDRSVDKNRQTGQVASMTGPRHQARAVDSESAKAGQGGGHSRGAAENASMRRSTTAGGGNSALVEQPMAADYGRTKSVLGGDETATRAVTLLETNTTKMQHVATSGTRSGKWITPGKYYMRVGNTHRHYVHRGWMRTYQNAGWRYDSWD